MKKSARVAERREQADQRLDDLIEEYASFDLAQLKPVVSPALQTELPQYTGLRPWQQLRRDTRSPERERHMAILGDTSPKATSS